MAVHRDNHREKGNFTQVSNALICDTRISSKAKLYLILMLSRPDTWKFSMDGLVSFIAEKESALQTGLDELERFGYLIRIKEHVNGRISYRYEIYETPIEETKRKPEKVAPAKKQHSEKQSTKKQSAENSGQKTASLSTYNSNIVTGNTVSARWSDKEQAGTVPKLPHGKYNNVFLTDNEYNALIEQFGKEQTDSSLEKMSDHKYRKKWKCRYDFRKLTEWIEQDIKWQKEKSPVPCQTAPQFNEILPDEEDSGRSPEMTAILEAILNGDYSAAMGVSA